MDGDGMIDVLPVTTTATVTVTATAILPCAGRTGLGIDVESWNLCFDVPPLLLFVTHFPQLGEAFPDVLFSVFVPVIKRGPPHSESAPEGIP